MSKSIDLTGRKFGKLTVLGSVQPLNGHAAWECICECGEHSGVMAQSLTSGRTTSCGCNRKARLFKHGEAGITKAYRARRDARSRVYNPNRRAYPSYGGRGIGMCESWNDYRVFIADMGTPKPDRSLDRLDVNLGYEPGNCYWATAEQQKLNRLNLGNK